ncbi:hypothetical protein TorRG33x02_228010 [Trema orientale]|uniref:Uncharacterized protein n=1 Tax=Trema orientale TaxID=63057 RepID=A0A2P5E7H9_TREOI|nr:hypothetical protein TorRG33x02_228010 [Trema orientale]
MTVRHRAPRLPKVPVSLPPIRVLYVPSRFTPHALLPKDVPTLVTCVTRCRDQVGTPSLLIKPHLYLSDSSRGTKGVLMSIAPSSWQQARWQSTYDSFVARSLVGVAFSCGSIAPPTSFPLTAETLWLAALCATFSCGSITPPTSYSLTADVTSPDPTRVREKYS